MSELHRELEELVYYPEHDPRKASSTYTKTHHHLVYEMDEPCWICGIRNSTAPKKGYMETHHQHLEWAAANGVDLAKIVIDFPDIHDTASLRKWLDSEGNMLVLCAKHHRGPRTGIHSITYPAWLLQRYQNGFIFIPQD